MSTYNENVSAVCIAYKSLCKQAINCFSGMGNFFVNESYILQKQNTSSL